MKTIPIALSALVAFAVTAALGIKVIPFLHRLKYGQTIRSDGPSWHKSKSGTPTMGGVMFITGILTAAVIAWIYLVYADESLFLPESRVANVRFFAGLGMAVAFGFVGFLDDYIKVVKHRNLGLRAREKFALQVLVAVAYLVTLYLFGDRGTYLAVPFLGSWDLGWFYYPAMAVFIVGSVNAVNLTDGIDGLAGSVTFLVALCMMFLSGLLGYSGMSLLATALAGGCVGFLVWNMHPAKVFMGDTGSLFLGGMVLALAFGVGLPAFLIPAGAIYYIEMFSVIIQVGYFKLTHGKRLFKMSPIHHHFELSGWSENKIVLRFSLVTLLGCAVAICAVFLM